VLFPEHPAETVQNFAATHAMISESFPDLEALI
jgi:hypothetical protein